MYRDIAAHPHSLALRPAHDAYRSMPGTPMGMDPRGSHAMELAAAMNHARAGLERAGTDDYFLGAPQYQAGAMRPRSPMIPAPGHESYHCNSLAVDGNNQNILGFRERARERDSEEKIRRYARTLWWQWDHLELADHGPTETIWLLQWRMLR